MNLNAAQFSEVADNLAKVQSFDPWSARWISEAHMLLRGLAAREPVAEVVEWKEDGGTSKNCVSFLCPIAEIPVGAKLYADAPSPKPEQHWPYGVGIYGPANATLSTPEIPDSSQPVEAVDVKSERFWFEAWARGQGFNVRPNSRALPHGGEYITADTSNAWEGWQGRAALAHPRPTGDAWTCFHCDETFGDRAQAALHFGTHELQKPACTIDVEAYRAMEAKEARYFDEDADIHRRMHRMANDHQTALRRAEETGYAKALKDTGYTEPTVEQAGEVVAFRIVGRNGSYPWVDASLIEKDNPPEAVIGDGERVEYAYDQPRAVGVPDGPLTGKYADVLVPFVALMERELFANAGKGGRDGWLAMTPEVAMLEIHHHVAKLQKAVLNGDIAGVCEYAADVANMSMMAVDVCGVLLPAPVLEGAA